MSYAMIDLYCASYARPPREVTLDIDDTVDVVHGAQQLSLFNTHSGERCFLPMHFYVTFDDFLTVAKCRLLWRRRDDIGVVSERWIDIRQRIALDWSG